MLEVDELPLALPERLGAQGVVEAVLHPLQRRVQVGAQELGVGLPERGMLVGFLQ